MILVEIEYLDSTDADHLNPALINPLSENVIRASGKELALPDFNCLDYVDLCKMIERGILLC